MTLTTGFKPAFAGVAALLAAVASTGCGGFSRSQSAVRVERVLIEDTSAPGTYDAVDLTAIVNSGLPIATDGTKITTNEYVLLHVTATGGPFGNCEYDVLFGPDPSTTESGQAWIDRATGGFMLGSGWAVLSGSMPWGRTTRTAAAADGTKFLIQIDKSGPAVVDRVYLLEIGASTRTEVRPRSGGASIDLRTANTYAENSSTTGPVTLGTGSLSTGPLADFLNRVKPIATQAGLGW